MSALLRSANTHFVGYFGLAVGGFSILGALSGLFKLLSDPTYLVALFGAIIRAHKHMTTPDDVTTFAKLVGVCVALFGAAVLSLVSAWLGRPATVPAG